jgi:hypothetical protein
VTGRRQQPDAGGAPPLPRRARRRSHPGSRPIPEVMRRLQLEPLNVDWYTGKQAIAAAVVEGKVRVNDAHHASGDVVRHRHRLAFLVQFRRRVDHAGVDEDDAAGALDRVHVHG